jgi:PAS domain S-box-containing protein
MGQAVTKHGVKRPLLVDRETHSSTRIVLIVLLCYFFLTVGAQGQDKEDIVSVFSTEQQSYLEQLGPITMCVDPDWEPYEYLDDDGEFKGIAADLLSLVTERTGITFELIHTRNWEESLEFSRKGKCQVLPFLNQSPLREEWLLFTEPYFEEHNVIITREEHEFIKNPALLEGKSIVLPAGSSTAESVRQLYPNLQILTVENEAEALNVVNNREADMTIRSLIVASYLIKQEGWFNLKIAGQLPDLKNKLRIGVLNTHPELRDILDVALKTLTPDDVRWAVNNHISVQVVESTDLTWVRRVMLGLAIALVTGVLWVYNLRQLNKRLARQQAEMQRLSRQLQLDIVAREEAEKALHTREQDLSRLIANLPGFVYKCLNDKHYTMQFISNGCLEITGYTPVDLLDNRKLSFSSLILAEDVGTVELLWSKALTLRTQFEHEYRIHHASGEVRWVWERGYGVFDDNGKLLRLEGFITDITEKRVSQNELLERESQLRELNARKDKFFSVITHDLKNPLNGVMGFAELLYQQVTDGNCEMAEKYALIVLNSSQQAVDLLTNLVEWSMTQTARYPFNPIPVDLGKEVDVVVTLYEYVASQKNIAINVVKQLETIVFADRHMVSSILRNLISNALKFSCPGGQIQIAIEKEAGYLRLLVEDQGVGMEAEQLESLFSINIEGSTKGTSGEKGTGLGLMICKEFADLHGWHLKVVSEPGKGSLFSVEMPDINHRS